MDLLRPRRQVAMPSRPNASVVDLARDPLTGAGRPSGTMVSVAGKRELRIGDMVEYLGEEDPANFLFVGQPGVVNGLGPTAVDVDISLAGGPSLTMVNPDVQVIDEATYRRRANRVARLRHPIRDIAIVPLYIADPVDGAMPLPPPGSASVID